MIRTLQEADIALIQEWHRRSGFDYPLPDLSAPATYIVDSYEGPVAAGTVKLIGEEYLWLNPDAKHPVRSLLNLQDALELDAKCLLNLDQLVAWLPKKAPKIFSGQIRRLEWRKSPWQSWAKNL